MPVPVTFPFSLQLFSATVPVPLWLPLAALAGAGLDRLLGEAKRFHPLVGFGVLADAAERAFNHGAWRRARGLLAWSLVVLPCVALAYWATPHNVLGWAVDAFLLYLALGGRSLAEHAARVAGDLAAGDLAAARRHVGWMVSRDTRELDESGVAKACVESTLENGNDAVFGALFWFVLLGAPGAVAFRIANTLDAMWGYRSERYRYFGWAAARFDDVLNFIPARLTALTYCLAGNVANGWQCWRAQARHWYSPNAGPVMTAGAGALSVVLGGRARYGGEWKERPLLGRGHSATPDDIAAAIMLLRRSLLIWLVVITVLGMATSLWPPWTWGPHG
jgi:adenosylcobinamide-phosphate synthase